VEIVFSTHFDTIDYLQDGRADLGQLYVPFDDAHGLEDLTLQTEDRVAVMSSRHRPAGRTTVVLDDLIGEPVLARPPARKSNALRSFVHAALSTVDTKQVPTSKIKKEDRS
jgi:DNA-binding transcriptional LysR family regulator